MIFCCCNCGSCTHRKFDADLSEQWHGALVDSQPCNDRVIDMVVRGSALYVLGQRNFASGNPAKGNVLQKWTLAGARSWSTDLEMTSPLRVDGDGTQVWVCSATGDDNLQAFGDADGVQIWTVESAFGWYDVEGDGEGGVFAAGAGGGTDCDDVSFGYVWQFASDGTLTRRFGANFASGATAKSLLLIYGKLWVGSGQWSTRCFCLFDDGSSLHNQQGYLARYDATTGAMERLTEAVYDTVETREVIRLCRSTNSNVLAGLSLPEDECNVIEFGVASGKPMNGYRVGESLTGLWCGTDFIAVTSSAPDPETSLLYQVAPTDGSLIGIRRHKGYPTGLTAVSDKVGSYVAVAVDPDDNVYVGGANAGCELDDDTVTAEPGTCSIVVPECGAFNAAGQVIVGCGYADGVPCQRDLHCEYTGCLADAPTTVPMYYYPGGPDGDAEWSGSVTFGSDPCEIRIRTYIWWDCEAEEWAGKQALDLKISGTYTEQATWDLVDIVPFCGTDSESTDGYPGFTFSINGTLTSGGMPDCLGDCTGFTGCGGYGATGCDIVVDCCEGPIPKTLHATLVSVLGCGGLDGATGDLTHTTGTIGGFTGDIWTGTFTICSGVTLTVNVWCDPGTDTWRRSISDSSGNCQDNVGETPATSASCGPLEIHYNNIGVGIGCTCCTAPALYNLVVTE